MTDLRTAAKRALKVLEQLQGGCTDADDGDALRLAVKCAQLFGFYRFLRAWIAAMAGHHRAAD